MKVLLVSSKYQPEYSGSGLRSHNLYKRLSDKFNIEYDVVCNSIIDKKNEQYIYEDIVVNKISYPIDIQNLTGLKRKAHIIISMFYEFYYTYKFIKKNNISNYDILHTFGNSWSVAFLTFYFSRYKKPIIRELVNTMNNPYYPIQFKGIFKNIFKQKNTLMVAISKQLENLCKEFNVNNIWQRPNPIDENKFYLVSKKEKIELRSKLTSFANEDIILLHVASYMKRKNHIFLLDLIKKLPKNYKLLLAGPVENTEHKKYYQKVINKIKEQDLGDRILLKSGFVDNIDEYIKMSDVFMFPTWGEALGTPILEAQACGVPVVANFMDGVTNYWIKENKAGFTVKDFDVDLWLKAIEKSLLIDKTTLEINTEYIQKVASTDNIDKQYINILKGMN